MASRSRSIELLGYTDQFSYEPGSPISLMVTGSGDASVELVRLRTGPHLEQTEAESVPWAASGRYSLEKQSSSVGSFMVVDRPWSEAIDHVSFSAWIWPTRAGEPSQTLFSTGDGQLSIAVDRGAVRVTLGTGAGAEHHVADTVIEDRSWYYVEVELTAAAVRITVNGGDPRQQHKRWTSHAELGNPFTLSAPSCLLIGAAEPRRLNLHASAPNGIATELFSGKIEAPIIVRGKLSNAERALSQGGGGAALPQHRILGGWGFELDGCGPSASIDNLRTGAPAGTLINLPTRGVTGHLWRGDKQSFLESAGEYAAVHFHTTDLVDAGWSPLVQAELPKDLESGVYGLRIATDTNVDCVPIVVLPSERSRRKRVAVVLPTLSYLAYGNETNFEGLDPRIMSSPPPSRPYDDDRIGLTDFGRSMYDTHSDGSGVVFSSWSRPLPNIRHDYSWWGAGPESGHLLPADMQLIEWLETQDVGFDVVTDLEVHQQGLELLGQYPVILTGHHPEYTSESMLDALTAYRDAGGRIGYLGGNGFYWVTEVYSDSPIVVEIRRGQSGIRCWESEPGEVTLVSTGTPGGLWRHRGRAPQKLVAIGMAAQGFDQSVGYTKTEAGRSGPYAWIFDGVEEEPFGCYGNMWDGAAGHEVDRADVALGTPTAAVVVACSLPFGAQYMRAIEELPMTLPGAGDGTTDGDVRSDVVYCDYPNGGAVFSVGTMAWVTSLLHNEGENGISRITLNVIRHFLSDAGGSQTDERPESQLAGGPVR